MSSEEIVKEINLSSALNDYDEYFHTKKYVFNNNEYTIIKYNKEKLKIMENTGEPYFNVLSKFRSLVVRNNKLIVFSPEKSLNFETFNKKYENINECWMEDFIDGTMINVFFDNINNTWEIATRSTVGGNIVFFNDIKNYSFFNYDNQFQHYNNITFRTMFFESCNYNNFDLNSLNTNYSYSFVMQHPFNRIVTPVQRPFIYLVKVYEIDNTSFPIVYVKEKNLLEFVNKPPHIFANTNVQLVNKYSLEISLNELKTHYDNKLAPYHCVGTIIYNKDGTRTKIRNVNYEEVRKLRGNQPKLQYNYLCLKKENKIKEFLHYYPEHVLLFNKFKLLMFEYTNELFTNYISCFIKKHKHLKEYPFQYKNHMYHIHQKYICDLKPNAKVVDKKLVIDYVNNLHPAQQMFVINYKYNPPTETSVESNVENNVENSEIMECNE
jgi:hypothetical protein